MARTETFDLDGINDTDLKQAFTISTNGSGERTETLTEENANTSLRDKTVRTIDSAGFVKTLEIDSDGDTKYELVTNEYCGSKSKRFVSFTGMSG